LFCQCHLCKSEKQYTLSMFERLTISATIVYRDYLMMKNKILDLESKVRSSLG
jgi:hypothetical protein